MYMYLVLLVIIRNKLNQLRRWIAEYFCVSLESCSLLCEMGKIQSQRESHVTVTTK